MLDDRCSFNSRYYNVAIAKFIEPDPIVPNASNPQALNRYAYALDNPLKLVDPSGHESMDPIWVKQYAAAHHGHPPTPLDWAERQISLASGRFWSSSTWKAFNSFIGTPKEAYTSLSLGTGLTKLAQGRELKIIGSYETGNVDFPIRFLGADLPTQIAEVAGRWSTGVGLATLILDEVNLVHQYATGSLPHPAGTSAATVLEEDFSTVLGGAALVFGAAAVATALAPVEVAAAVAVGATLAVGALSTAAVGALESGFQSGNWSWANLEQGAASALGI